MNVLGVLPVITPSRTSVEEQSHLFDSFARLGKALRASFALGEPISVAVTSPRPATGKTFVAANLAISLGQRGFRTILVDADPRGGNQRASTLLGALSAGSLHDDGTLGTSVNDVAVATAYERCFALPYRHAVRLAGTTAQSGRSALHEGLRAYFDVSIVDGPWWGTHEEADAVLASTSYFIAVHRDVMAMADLDSGPRTNADPRWPVPLLGHVLNGVTGGKER